MNNNEFPVIIHVSVGVKRVFAPELSLCKTDNTHGRQSNVPRDGGNKYGKVVYCSNQCNPKG